MPSVLLFHGSADLYGSDRTVIDLVEGLRDASWKVDVALPHAGPLVEVLEQRGARVHVGGFSPFGRATTRPLGLVAFPFRLAASTRACLRLVRDLRPSLVHVNTLIIPAPALAARWAGVPLVWHVHEIMTRPRLVASALARLVTRVSDRVACNSEATLERLAEASPGVRDKAVVISNGVTDHPARPAREVREALGVPPDRFVFLFVGRLNAWKGQELFVEAAARVLERHPEAYFLAAGDAPPGQPAFRESFQELLRAKDLGDSFQWLGFHPDTHSLYCAADAAVVPSLLPEPFGLVAAEAMAASLPVVAAAHGGLREIVVDDVTGKLVTPGDLDSLTRAMLELLEDPRRAAEMGRAGKSRQLANFSVARYQERFLELYARLPAGA